ncbi:hypothetical protein [Fictibacillus phosphorivorans]|uniref:hypothetical protein n=1 Tax=Fictibacillus phosphorivorans TaxID=1221500 RepID=UPI00203E4C83|nr:hypothetical protein [Fictibacillus phosphorivorans]MCM3719140.1 hypothetical protein [Fictibacillus phosphorivorans]MCM3776762.1 hypothetical protein [Fictibacillus phosphorivorans]
MPIVDRLAIRAQLAFLAASGQIINEVYVLGTQIPGEPLLTAVTVKKVSGNFVVFNQAGSGGLGDVIIVIDKIVGLDTLL